MASLRLRHAGAYINAPEAALNISSKHNKSKVSIESVPYQDADKCLTCVGEELKLLSYIVCDR